MTDSIRTQVRQTTAALIAVALVLSVLGPVGIAAAAPGVDVTQTPSSTTVAPGDTVEVTTTVNVDDIDSASAAIDVNLPAGWEIVDHTSDASSYKPSEYQWLWFATPAVSGDKTVTFTVQVPSDAATGTYTVSGIGSGFEDGEQLTTTATSTIAVEAPTGTYGVETGTTTDVQINTSTLTNASATMNGTLTLGDKSEATPYVKIWPEEQPEDAFWYTGSSMSTTGEFSFDVVLSPSTTYVWQTLSQSGDGEWKAGTQKTFTTPTGQFFGVGSDGATDVGVESATLNGEITNLGDNDDAQVYFTYWKQGQKDSTLTWWTGSVKSSPGSFAATIGELDPDTAYEFRAFGQSNEGEWKASPVQTFTTQDGQSYGVDTLEATNVGPSSATLQGELTGLGDADSATVYITYWKQGQKDSTLTWWTGTSQTSPGSFAAAVDSLDPGTTYEFKAYAQSDEGVWEAGEVKTVTTDGDRKS